MPRSRCVWWQEMEGKVWSDLRAHHGLASSEESNVWKWQWQGWVIPGDSWLGSKDAVKAFVHLQSVQYTCFLFASVFGICGGKPRRRDQHLTSTCFPWLRNNNNFWYLKQRFFFIFFSRSKAAIECLDITQSPDGLQNGELAQQGMLLGPSLVKH